MFKDIDIYKIKINYINKSSIAYIPNIISMNPVDDLLKATEWLASEAINDYNSTNEKIEERRKKEGYTQKNLDDFENLNIRLGSRTLGYINQICLMDDILTSEYRRMSEMLYEASENKISINVKQDLQALKERLSPIRIFRNKVAAHVVYTHPKKDDNPETKIRSILNLFPGEGKIFVGGNYFSGFSKYKSQLPLISIFLWEDEIKPIFQDWKKLFIKKLEEIHKQCPMANKKYEIEVANPYLVQKARKQ
ncbi:MAG: hypothetical protein WC437_04545 [Patescibacteria group bacterium]